MLSAVTFCDMQTICIQIRLLGSSLIEVHMLVCKFNLVKSPAVLSADAFCDVQAVCIQIRLLGSSLIRVNTLAGKLIYYARKM